jgi:hypothetical protein
MLTGVGIPPAGGPARQVVLRREGSSYLRQSQRQYGSVVASLPGHVAALLPPWTPLGKLSAARTPLEQQLAERRSAAWAQTQSALHATADEEERLDLERRAREALDAAVTAFNFLEDADLADAAHGNAHAVAEFVGRMFGCHAEYRNGRFWDVWPLLLLLMHLRIGLSPGFTGPRLCSVCREDLSECLHVPGVAVSIVVENREEHCSACRNPWPCTQHHPDPASTSCRTASSPTWTCTRSLGSTALANRERGSPASNYPTRSCGPSWVAFPPGESPWCVTAASSPVRDC